MYFKATATTNTSDRKRVENLDSMKELQEFGVKAVKMMFNTLVVDAYDQGGYVKTNTYTLNPSEDTWEMIR